MKKTAKKFSTVLGDVTVILNPSSSAKESFSQLDKVSDKENLHQRLREREGQLWKWLGLQVSMFGINLFESYSKTRHELIECQRETGLLMS
jgi:hypothetical protein